MYGELVINLTPNEMKQFDWTISVAHKCGPNKLDQRGVNEEMIIMSFDSM